MGEVYLAHDDQLQRPVALKVLARATSQNADLRKRLEQEARAASALNHPNILTVYDVGFAGDEQFIATEFVDGITLRQRMIRAEPAISEVLDIAIQIASALAAAEAAGLVHRDIKPDNVMLRADGYVKLLDFGLARAAVATRERDSDPAIVKGTVFYMSPEQLRGQLLDTRSDLWSLGVLLYELISGRLPFEGISSAVVASNILRAEPPPLTRRNDDAVPPRLAAIVARALVKDKARRYQSATEMLDELQGLRGDIVREPAAVEGTFESRMATTEQFLFEGTAPTNLPVPLTPLVGRDVERDDVVALLRREDVRLLTLTGPGGTGKTRLSLAAGAQLLREYDDGVWWVSLAPITDPHLVVAEIASVIGVAEGGTRLIDTVKAALRSKSALLILDNLEQVMGAAPLLAEILTGAPRVKMLVTSRSPLRVRGEREYAVPPLMTPPLDLPLEAAALADFPSVALFVQRAASVKSDFSLTPGNVRAIAEICVRLDGLPLAIELAAARVKMLPPQALLSRVEHRLDLLSGGSRDLPKRQQTMRAAISWGYELLDDEEKELFATLSVFRGGFSLDAAERVVWASGLPVGGETTGRPEAHTTPDVLDGIQSLIDKAFLRRDTASSDEAPRFAMLETIREYGNECLVDQGRLETLRAAHARLMASIAEECELEIERIAADDDNFRAAIDWATSANDAELALRLGAALWWSWYVRGHYGEGRRWLDAILDLPDGHDVPIRAKALTGAGGLAFLQCDYDRAISLLDDSIDLARAYGDPMSLARSLQFRGSIARERGEYDHAIDLHLLSRTIWAELEDRANVGRSVNFVAFSSWLNRDFARTFELCDGTLQLFRDRKDTEGVVWSLLNLAAASLYSGQLDLAEQRLEECLSWSRTGHFKEGLAWSLNFLGDVLRARLQHERALALLIDSLALHWELGDRWRSASVLEAIGALRREPRLFGAAAALRKQLGTPVPPVEREQYEKDVAAIGIEEWTGPVEEAVTSLLRYSAGAKRVQ